MLGRKSKVKGTLDLLTSSHTSSSGAFLAPAHVGLGINSGQAWE